MAVRNKATEASCKNLISLGDRPVAEARAIQSMGGKVKSPNKKLARKLYWLKQRGMTDAAVQELHDMLTSEDVSDLTILKYITTLREMAESDGGDFNKIKASIELLLKWRRDRFGSKVSIDGEIKVDWSNDVSRILKGCNIIDVKFKEKEENGK